LALMALLTLRGTPVLYYGDEIGMTEVELRPEHLRDPVGLRRWPEEAGRDPMRTPMQWSAAEGGGFTDPEAVPWLPLGDHRACNVEDQRPDPASALSFTRELVALRRRLVDLRTGVYEHLVSPPGTWAWRRGGSVVVALNLSGRKATVQGVDGAVAASASHGRIGERIVGELELPPWDGVVVESVTM
jgi:alpha-glucosidase